MAYIEACPCKMQEPCFKKADILLLDEPPNHLDVMSVAWVKKCFNSLDNVTTPSIIVKSRLWSFE
jgi:ATPase subunit of ABC transporter with duplicated ATPase domains